MSEDPNGRLSGDADEPREPFEKEDRILGYCVRRGMRVTDEECLECFQVYKMPYERIEVGNRRMTCVAVNIRPLGVGPADTFTAADLNALSEESVRAILGNGVMVAQTMDRNSPAGRTLISEVRLHMSRLPVEELPI
mgnify:CR=1 FL=1